MTRAEALEAAHALVQYLEAANDDEPVDPIPTPATGKAMAWGAKVSQVFRDRVQWLADDLAMDVNHLMACMAWESGRSFRADVKNMAGSGATGLIQFMPNTARNLGTTTAALAKMTPEDQLNFVWKYFAPNRGRLKTLGDVYGAILWPAMIGKPDSYVLWDQASRPTTYRQNAGLDTDKNGRITRGETVAKVAALLEEGLRPGNVWRPA